MSQKRKLIALCERLPQLVATDRDLLKNPVIEVTIATTEEENGHTSPRNWMLHYDEAKNSTGGCYARMWGTTMPDRNVLGLRVPTVLFSHYGPDVRNGTERDYRHGLKALRRVQKGMDARQREFGNAEDAGASLDRWLHACGLKGKCVWTRPEGHTNEGWLNRGQWDVLTIDEFVELVRTKLPKEVSA